MRRTCTVLFLWAVVCPVTRAAKLEPGGVQLLCHRTANEDVPENTLESLQQAALLGCNVIELDIRRTLDGELVLNHDGILERLTDGIGDVESSYFDDLQLRDAGSWMGERFDGLRFVKLEDVLRFARKSDVRLILDVKTKGIGVDVLQLLQREGMLERVQFNGEWQDVKQFYPAATDAGFQTAWMQPGVTAEQVKAAHREGKAVVVNFSTNGHEMDLASMKAAVAAGVDGINVDYPRLGADAVGRPVERKLNALAKQANAGPGDDRAKAILELSRYRGFTLEGEFSHWLLDSDDHVSRAAAVALVIARPQTSPQVFAEALHSEHADARANAAWALGVLKYPADILVPLLDDKEPRVLQEVLLALAHMPGDVSANNLLPLLAHPDSEVRGTAALALARHQPELAVKAVPERLQLEVQQGARLNEDYVRRGRPQLTQAEISEITGYFRAEMKMVQAISMLKGPGGISALEELAFHSSVEFAQMNGMIAGFQLWDRIGANAEPAVEALGSKDVIVADRAEWMLIHGGPAVLPAVRIALASDKDPAIRERAIRIVAWQGDAGALEILQSMQVSDPSESELVLWAIDKIESLHPKM